jgi:hypothetical protein
MKSPMWPLTPIRLSRLGAGGVRLFKERATVSISELCWKPLKWVVGL